MGATSAAATTSTTSSSRSAEITATTTRDGAWFLLAAAPLICPGGWITRVDVEHLCPAVLSVEGLGLGTLDPRATGCAGD